MHLIEFQICSSLSTFHFLLFSLKSMLKTHEKIMCANVALLVKWADFAGRDSTYSMNSEYIFLCVKDFKDALNVSFRGI